LTVLLLAGWTLLTGSSLHGLLDGVLLQHVQFPTLFFWKPPLDSGALLAGVAGVALCLWTRRAADADRAGRVLDAAKLAFGVYGVIACWLPEAPYFLFLGLPFVWLAGVRPCAPGTALARTTLIALTVTQSLLAYPVPGSQQFFATMLIPVTAVVCLADVPSRLLPASAWRVAGVLIVALLGLESFQAYASIRAYEALTPLDLPGAERVRLPEERVALYRWLCYNLRERADAFVTEPGINSLYFWTGTEPPTGLNTTAWMFLLDDARQQQIVDRLAAHQHTATMRCEPLLRLFTARGPTPRPLARLLHDNYRTVATFPGYEFRLPKERDDTPLLFAGQWLKAEPTAPGQTVRLALPALAGQTLARVQVVDLTTGEIIADVADSLELSSPAQLHLEVPARPPEDHIIVARLLASDGRRITSVPIVQVFAPKE
jgi:hypothetical protein